jgi:hypothetical protein
MGGNRHFEYLLIAAVMLISLLGFWDIYLGPDSDPQPHHHLHVATTFAWMGLLLVQLRLIDSGGRKKHRSLGLLVLVAAPLLVATTAMLSVHSAHRGLVSGEGDFLIVQNVMGTFWLALLIALAFLLRKRRKLHAAFLLSTLLLFMGIALFFALISFAPPFKIEGPETFYRFQTAAITGQGICLLVGVVFFVRDVRNGWPFLLAPLTFLLNEAVRLFLTERGLIDPLTEWVGSKSQPLTFIGSFALLLSFLAATFLPIAERRRAPDVGGMASSASVKGRGC